MRIRIVTLLASIALYVYASEDRLLPITVDNSSDMCVPLDCDSLSPITIDNSSDICVLFDCDTIMSVDGYSIHLIRDNGEDVFSGLNIFSQEMKESVDKDLLGRIESDLYKMILQKSEAKHVISNIVKGKLTDFRSITPETPCNVKISNAKKMIVEWSINGKTLEIAIPVSYETAKGNNRSETENLLIRKIKQSDGKRNSFHIEKSNLESYGEDLFVLPGEAYQNKNITRNIYLDSELKPIWDTKYPSESLANFFIFPSDKYGDIQMDLTVLKHEYGEKETVTIPVLCVLSGMENEGCVPYWGVEIIKNGMLEGALFFFNPKQGYDHVLKIECNPEDIINGKGNIKARASLYIPTNNVDNLNAPYIKKSDDERIKYEK